MKFFDLDIHVSVVSDITQSFSHIGHEVEEHVMSAHWWALNKIRANKGSSYDRVDGRVGYGPVNLATWESMFFRPEIENGLPAISHDMVAQCPELAKNDGFVCCYPPSFAYLYAKFNKPIIVNMPVRYEWPFSRFPGHWQRLNDYLIQGQVNGKIAMVGNSKYECEYYEYFTGHSAKYISSTCDYIDKFSPKYMGTQNVVFALGQGSTVAEQVPGVYSLRRVLPRYNYTDLVSAKALVWIPYNCSIMSFFEHYWLNIPLFVPSIRFVLEMHASKSALCEMSWDCATQGSLISKSGKTDLPDPAKRDSYAHWLHLFDFYNEIEFPFLTYFDTWSELGHLLTTTNLKAVSESMAAQNIKRKAQNLLKWKDVINGLFSKS